MIRRRLLLFISALALIAGVAVPLLKPGSASAAGETYEWTSGHYRVSGGDLSEPSDLLLQEDGDGSLVTNTYAGTLQHESGCTINMEINSDTFSVQVAVTNVTGGSCSQQIRQSYDNIDITNNTETPPLGDPQLDVTIRFWGPYANPEGGSAAIRIIGPIEFDILRDGNRVTDGSANGTDIDTVVGDTVYTMTYYQSTPFTVSPTQRGSTYELCPTSSNASSIPCMTFTVPENYASGEILEINDQPNPDAASAENDDWCEQEGDPATAWWMCGLIDSAAAVSEKLDCQVISLLKINTVNIFGEGGVADDYPDRCDPILGGAPNSSAGTDDVISSNAYYSAWSAFRNVALAILVILGLIMVASQILGLEIFNAYSIRKMLPKLIIATIFLTLSWPIMQFLFTASNAAADAVMAIIEFPFRDINAADGTSAASVTLGWILLTLLGTGAAIGAVVAVGLLSVGGILALLAALALAVFSAWVLLIARDVIATLLIIVSPLAIICAAYEPFEKLFSFWKGVLITILLSVPALAAVLATTHAAAFISYLNDQIVVAAIIFLAGYILLWVVFKQLDKVTGYLGNIASRATGGAQNLLTNYAKGKGKQRYQEALEGRRNIPFAKTMRRAHLSGQAGKGGFFGTHNRAQLAAAEQAFMQQSAKKRLEEEGGRMSGDDDAMALAMQRGMTRERFISDYEARTGRDGRRALADMEASFGAQVGTGAMRVAAARARWGSVSAYNDFDIDTPEGARDMYRQMMQDAGEMVADGQMSVTDVVAAMKANNQRADISGHSFPQMMDQVQQSANRLQQVRSGQVGPGGLQGRVIDENGQTVQGLQQATGARRNQAGQAVGPSLISDSEIDNWMRGSLEYAQPGQLVAGRTETVRILGQHMRGRLERTVAAQQQAEQFAQQQAQQHGGNSPQAVEAQQTLQRAERETKRQLAALAGRYEVMGQISPENARYMAENVMEHDINMGAAGNMNIQQLIEQHRSDQEFQQYRREYYGANMAGAQAQQQAQAQAAAAGQQPGAVPPVGGPGAGPGP